MATARKRILIVDDHAVLRRGLIGLISQQGDLEVCGEADSVPSALKQARGERPDLVIVDMSLKEGHGLDLIKSLADTTNPPKMLVLSMHEDASYAERALHAGAQGYLSKSEAADKVIDAIRAVLGGDIYLNPAIASRILGGMVGGKRAGRAPHDLLSDREIQVFELLGRGLSSREIGRKLSLSVKTIDTYREHIKQKLGIGNANELLLHAILWTHGAKPATV